MVSLRCNPNTLTDLLLDGVSAGIAEQDLADLEGRGPEGGSETSGNHCVGVCMWIERMDLCPRVAAIR